MKDAPAGEKKRKKRVGVVPPIARGTQPYSLIEDIKSRKADITLGQLLGCLPAARRELVQALSTREPKPKTKKKQAATMRVAAEKEKLPSGWLRKNRVPAVKALVNGFEVHDVMIDGGSSTNLINEAFLKALGLDYHKQIACNTVFRDASNTKLPVVGIIENVKVVVQGISVHMGFTVVDLPGWSSAYDLIFGQPWLELVHGIHTWRTGVIEIGPADKRVQIEVWKEESATSEEDLCFDDDEDLDALVEMGTEDDYSSTEFMSDTEVYELSDSDHEVEMQEDMFSDFEHMHVMSVRMASDQLKPSFTVKHPAVQKLVFPGEGETEKYAKVGAQVEGEELATYRDLFSRYQHLFITGHDDMPATNLGTFKIDIPEETKPKLQKLRRIAPHHMKEVKEEVERLLKAGCIVPVQYPEWVSPIVISMKKNGKIRMCVDFRELNKATRKDKFPLPHVDDILDQVAGNEYYSFCDGYSGFHQVAIAEEDQPKTAFVTPWGVFMYKVMPFGLCNAPAVFQMIMTMALETLIGKTLRVFLDDFAIFGRRVEHPQHLEEVFERLTAANIGINPDKCFFAVEGGELLGFMVDKHGIHPEPGKLTKFAERPLPVTAKEVRSFVQAASYYRRLLPEFTSVAAPLYGMLKKEAVIQWSEEELAACEKLRELMVAAMLIRNPDWNEHFFVSIEVTDISLEYNLFQFHADTGLYHPVYFAGRLMKGYETRYNLMEKTTAAMVAAVKKYSHYLTGREFTFLVKVHAIRFLMMIPNPAGRFAKWMMALAGFAFNIQLKTLKFSVLEAGLCGYEIDELGAGDVSLEDARAVIAPQGGNGKKGRAVNQSLKALSVANASLWTGDHENDTDLWQLWTDGAVAKRKAGIGAILVGPGGGPISKISRPIPLSTNNKAEYQALLCGLREAQQRGAGKLQVFCDSQLLVKQLLGMYEVKKPSICSSCTHK